MHVSEDGRMLNLALDDPANVEQFQMRAIAILGMKPLITITGGTKVGDIVTMEGKAMRVMTGSSEWKKGEMAKRYFLALHGETVTFPMKGGAEEGLLRRVQSEE